MKKFLSMVLSIFMISVISLPAQAKGGAVIEIIDNTMMTGNTELRKESTNRWTSTVKSYLYDNGGNTFNVVDCGNEEVTVSTYSKGDYSLLDAKKIPFELALFGGFYSGKNYNYIVFGQNNKEEDNSKEVIRIVKYDKEFNRLAQASVNDCFTIKPFDAGTLKIAESDNELVIHTSRLRYTTDDGKNHQSNLTIVLDSDNMKVKNELGEYQSEHVSHSFNQFVIHDGENFVLADHGDAYPRSIVLHKHTEDEYTKTNWYDTIYDEVDLFEIPGAVGANCTGVTVGGFECSDNNYLAAINTIDHSKVTEYTSFEMKGLNKEERDIVLLVSGKNNTDTSKVKKVYLTDYVNKNKLGSKPYLAKLSDDRFLVLWEEYEYTDKGNNVDNGVKYVQVNGSGEVVSDIRTRADMRLSKDCQPVKIDNKLMWYVDGNERSFYAIDLDNDLITVTVNGKIINFDQPPTIIDGRTLVPVRAIFEALGAAVDWNDETQTVTSKKGNTTIALSIDSNTMYKDGKAVKLDVPAQLINDRTLVPARAVAEAFGCTVDWDSDTQKVIINE